MRTDRADRADVCAFAVMAKAPRIGEVKTRLVPPLRADEAALLSGCFIKDITTNFNLVARQLPAQGYVAYSPPGSESAFRELIAPGTLLLPPRRIGLGYSLLHAAEDLIAGGFGGACLVNADSPTLPTSVLFAAAEALRRPGDSVVLGPAIDGGYYLIGLKRPHQRLFEDISWSTEHVLRQTLERAASLGLEVVTLPTWYDVDDATSFGWLCEEILAGRRRAEFLPTGYAAPHTARYLRSLVEANEALRLDIGHLAEELQR
ncbi:MAG TPA: TIGR04282 family arsenosugar biosynthesis glycosyltransferase [Stellaceae bacterium]|nr:TIGR04282 family arsenosugar biosynthesis glycosyltransferase [Stellaceae bacterium]